MKIVITGSAGYIGSSLCGHITKLYPDTKIVGFDNLYYKQWKYVKKSIEDNNIEFYNQNILDWSSDLINHIKTADYIVGLAAIVGAPACDKVPEIATNINYRWFKDLLNIVDGNQKILYPNTNSGYGKTSPGIVCTEDSPSSPISLYGKLKQDAEDLLLKYYLNTVCFRLATVFGLSPRPRLDLLVNNLTYRATKDKSLTIFDGHFRRNFISVNDVCRAFGFCISHFETMAGQTYNLGADSLNSTKLEFAKQIQKVINCKIIENNDRTDPDKRDYVVSSQKLYNTGFYIEDCTLDRSILGLHEFCKNLTDTSGMFNY